MFLRYEVYAQKKVLSSVTEMTKSPLQTVQQCAVILLAW